MQNTRESAQLEAGRISYAIRMFFVGVLVLLVSGSIGMFELLLFVMPILIAITGVVSSLKYAAVVAGALISISVLVSLLSVPFELMLFLSMVGLLTAYGIVRRKSPEETMLWITVFSGALFSIWSHHYYKVTGEKITRTIVLGYQKLFTHNRDLESQIEMLSGIEIRAFVSRTLYFLPAGILCLSFVLALTTFYFTGRTLNRYTKRDIFPKFREFRMPGSPFVILGIFLFVMFAQLIMGEHYPIEISITMLITLCFIFYIQGLATLTFGIKRVFSSFLSNLLILGVGLVFPMVAAVIGAIDFVSGLREEKEMEE
ncbi:MAG: DUF2232 domain-containing protein [Filifactor alocis]|nr:DUF2232 domain-containing protein [Filifactor alocis]